MSQLVWGATGTRLFETGVDRGVLFPPNAAAGVAWNGLTSVKEAPSGGDPQSFYLDGVKYFQIASSEDFDATIEAFSAPVEFAACDGTANIYAGLFITQQPRKQFGFSYRTLVGNDVDADGHGYKIHLVYNALAKPTHRERLSIADNTEPMALSWDVTTVPPAISGFKPSAHLVIDSLTASAQHLTAVENIIYGQVGIDPRLPTVSELLTIFATVSVPLSITDNGDGTFSGVGDPITTDGDTFTINDASITDNGDGTFTTT